MIVYIDTDQLYPVHAIRKKRTHQCETEHDLDSKIIESYERALNRFVRARKALMSSMEARKDVLVKVQRSDKTILIYEKDAYEQDGLFQVLKEGRLGEERSFASVSHVPCLRDMPPMSKRYVLADVNSKDGFVYFKKMIKNQEQDW